MIKNKDLKEKTIYLIETESDLGLELEARGKIKGHIYALRMILTKEELKWNHISNYMRTSSLIQSVNNCFNLVNELGSVRKANKYIEKIDKNEMNYLISLPKKRNYPLIIIDKNGKETRA